MWGFYILPNKAENYCVKVRCLSSANAKFSDIFLYILNMDNPEQKRLLYPWGYSNIAGKITQIRLQLALFFLLAMVRDKIMVRDTAVIYKRRMYMTFFFQHSGIKGLIKNKVHYC